MLWFATESTTTWLPGFRAEMIPPYLANKIRFVVKGSSTGIEVDMVVGTVVLSNGDTLHIKPKVGEINFFRMLLTCEGLQDELQKELENFASYEESQESSLPSLVARRLLYELHYILKTSLRFERTKVVRNRLFAEGKVLTVPTAMNLRKKAALPVVSEVQRRDFNTAENRLLAQAARLAIEYTGTLDNKATLASAKYWINRFSQHVDLADDLAEVNRNIRMGRYAGPRGYYVRALALAKILLGESGLIQGSAEEVFGDTALINSATLFENYIRAIIAKSYHSKGFSVRKGGQPAEFLYTDGSYRLTPDICILKGIRYVFIGDAKYKKPDAKDHYQMHSYMRAYNLLAGVLFTPVFEGAASSVETKVTHEGTKVIEVRLPLSNLDATEEILGQLHHFAPFGN